MKRIDPLKELKAAVAEAGTARAWAVSAGITPQYLSDVLQKRRPVSKRLLAALGLRRVETIERVARGAAPRPPTPSAASSDPPER